MLMNSALSSVVNPLHVGKRGALWSLLFLAFLFVLFALPHSAVSAQVTCDIPNPAGGYICRSVPEYFMENVRAKDRYLAEVLGRARRHLDGGPEFTMPSELTTGNYGYRCPDAQGECATAWIPGPENTSGLSMPNSFVGPGNFNRATTNFQRVNGAGIGVQSIVDQRPIDAVDVWGEGAQGGGEVCFLGEGRIIYLDARTSPRAQSTLASTSSGDPVRTCATMPGPGTVVFLPPSS